MESGWRPPYPRSNAEVTEIKPTFFAVNDKSYPATVAEQGHIKIKRGEYIRAEFNEERPHEATFVLPAHAADTLRNAVQRNWARELRTHPIAGLRDGAHAAREQGLFGAR